MTDGPGWLGYFFFLGVIALSGVLAIITAFVMRGFFNILYAAGLIAVASAISYLPLSIRYNAKECHLSDIKNKKEIVGTWKTDYYELDLNSDSTYALRITSAFDDRVIDSGWWWFGGREIHLSTNDSLDVRPWLLLHSDGYDFIRIENPDNADAWSGDLGLMRQADWDSTHEIGRALSGE